MPFRAIKFQFMRKTMEFMQTSNNLEIYLDNNATTQALPEVIAEMISAIGKNFGNPSSTHSAGDRSREILISARAFVADLLACDPEKITFTSCGTESNNLVLSSVMNWSGQAPCIVTSSVEHSSVLAMCEQLEKQGATIVQLPVDKNGLINLSQLEKSLDMATLVSVQWVNNETGVIQPVGEIASLCKNAGVPFHTDAAQAVGKLPIALAETPIDFLTLTGHKFHAPQGIGVLYAKGFKRVRPMFFGGSQENCIRPGTENMGGIAGLGRAADIRHRNFAEIVGRINSLRSQFEELVVEKIPSVRINGLKAPRVCNTSNMQFEGLDGQALIARLDQAGIRC